MPYSTDQGKLFFEEWYAHFAVPSNIRKVLDIGAGAGTYANHIHNVVSSRNLPKPHLTGIEIYEPYIFQFHLQEKYDRIVIADGIEWIKNTNETFDLITMGDILEHLSKENAVDLFRLSLSKSKYVMLSVPCVVEGRTWSTGWKQGEEEYRENIHEKHLVDWTYNDLIESLGGPFLWKCPFPIVCVLIAEGRL